jgi:hypothetical protein
MMTAHHSAPVAALIKSSRKSEVHRERIDGLMANFANVKVFTGVPSRLFSAKSMAPSRSKDIKVYWKLTRQELTEEEYKAAKNSTDGTSLTRTASVKGTTRGCLMLMLLLSFLLVYPLQIMSALPLYRRPKHFGGTRGTS